VVLSVGRLVAQKAPREFLAVAEACLREEPRLRFVLIGAGPLRDELAGEIAARGLQDHVRLEPFRREIERAYRAADLFLHVAHWEPLANAILEALASGLPVVASEVDGTREAVPPGSSGSLFPAGDVARASAAILALARDPAERRRVGEEGRAHVLAAHAPARVLPRYKALFLAAGLNPDEREAVRRAPPDEQLLLAARWCARRNGPADRAWIAAALGNDPAPELRRVLLAAAGHFRIAEAAAHLRVVLPLAEDDPQQDLLVPAALALGLESHLPEGLAERYRDCGRNLAEPFAILKT
jgi:hypothetical protein